ncbi:MAG: hypothetical protein NTY03_13455 [Candidatus Bathyarchaeota archaeon]|nr:hypothetical protein [Candidatus Bathyarchaeota archaeon]
MSRIDLFSVTKKFPTRTTVGGTTLARATSSSPIPNTVMNTSLNAPE